MPARTCSSVVFPLPERPMIPLTRPGATSKSMSLNTVVPPNRTPMARAVIIGVPP